MSWVQISTGPLRQPGRPVTPHRRGPAVALAFAALVPSLAVGVATGVITGVGVATAPPAQAAPGSCATTGLVTSCTFVHNGSWQAWAAPAGVRKATFVVVGAAGGSADGQPGGRGGGIEASFEVTPGEELRLYVGGKGGSGSDPVSIRGLGGWNGGGPSGGGLIGGAGGGGASDVRVAPYGASDRIVVGGGGGGAGSQIYDQSHRGFPGDGGHGGGFDGVAGGGNLGASNELYASSGASGHGGGGATATAAGAGGNPSTDTIYNGCGWWAPAQPRGGSAGSGAVGGAGGYLKVLWTERRCDQAAGWGGGGGGGWHGGGGGGSGVNGAGGGGGGSGYAARGYVGPRLGEPGAHGVVTISYVRPTGDWVSLGGEAITSAPTVAVRPWLGSRLTSFHDVFYLNAAGAVIQRTFFEGVPRPEVNLGATLFPGSTVAAVWRDGFPARLDLFGRGTEGALWQKSFDGNSWGPWLARTGPGQVTSDPTAVSLRSGRLDVLFRAPDGRLTQLTSTDGRWSALPTPVDGPTISSGPGGTIASPGRVDVLARCDSSLCWWRYDGIHWTFHGTVTLAGASSAPAVTSPGQGVVDGVVEAVVRDESHDLTRLRFSGTTGWGVVGAGPIPSAPGQAVAVATGGSGASVAYARGPDDRLIAKAPW